MSLRTWWLKNRLLSVERKLRIKRFRQRKAREQAEALAVERRKGLAEDEADRREAKLAAARDKLTAEVAALMADEERLKRELAAARTGSHGSSGMRH